jgi:hypothetical protein
MIIYQFPSPYVHVKQCVANTWDNWLNKMFQTWYDILQITFFEALWQGFLGFFIPSYEDVGICQRDFGHCQITLPRCKIIHLLQQ